MKIRELIERLEKLEKDYDNIYAEENYKPTAFSKDEKIRVQDIGDLFLIKKNKVITINDLILALEKVKYKDIPIKVLFNDGTKQIEGLIEDIRSIYTFPENECNYMIEVRKGDSFNDDSEGTN